MAMPRDADARRYYRVAQQRLDEALLIYVKIPLYAAAEYLGGYAVECALKALLLTVTPKSERPAAGEETVEWMKSSYGHNLQNLRRGIAARGAVMDRLTAREFLFVSSWNPEQRYDPGPGDPESAKRFLTAAGTVVDWAKGKISWQ